MTNILKYHFLFRLPPSHVRQQQSLSASRKRQRQHCVRWQRPVSQWGLQPFLWGHAEPAVLCLQWWGAAHFSQDRRKKYAAFQADWLCIPLIRTADYKRVYHRRFMAYYTITYVLAYLWRTVWDYVWDYVNAFIPLSTHLHTLFFYESVYFILAYFIILYNDTFRTFFIFMSNSTMIF